MTIWGSHKREIQKLQDTLQRLKSGVITWTFYNTKSPSHHQNSEGGDRMGPKNI